MNDQALKTASAIEDDGWDDAMPLAPDARAEPVAIEHPAPTETEPIPFPVQAPATPRRKSRPEKPTTPAPATEPPVDYDEADAAAEYERVHKPSTFRPATPPDVGRPLPHSIEAEEYLISCCLLDGADVLRRCDEAKITSASFYDTKHEIIFAELLRMREANKPIDISVLAEELKASGKFDTVGGYAFLTQVSSRIPTTAQAGYFIDKVREQALLRELIHSRTGVIEECYNFSGGIDEFLDQIAAKEGRVIEEAGAPIREQCYARRFNLAEVTAAPIPRFFINGHAVCTPGNLTNIIAQAKAGKTALIAAILAASFVAESQISDRDTLGVTATAHGNLTAAGRGEKILIHIDTEQSRWDHGQIVRSALRRAGIDEPPLWFWSFGLAGFSADALRRALIALIRDAARQGGVFAIIIDGTADLVNDVNDAKESNAFVAELHRMAIEHDCPIINVVHENPGQDAGKMRGHFGSQLERKAESNLRLRKTGETTVVFSEKMRKAPILEKDGPRFRWDEIAGMHLSCATAGATKDDVKRERLRDQAEAVFLAASKAALSWSEVRDGIAKSEDIGKSGATKRFDAMKDLGVITKDMVGHWRLAT